MLTIDSFLVIRPIVENDFPKLKNYCLPNDQAIFTSMPENIIEAYKKDHYNQPYVIYCNNSLVGCFALYTNMHGNFYTTNEHAIVFKSFSIDARYQKRGHALNTLKVLPNVIKLTYPDKDEMILTVHHTNIPAISLYKKARFVDKGLRYEGDYGEELIFHFGLK
ncbi:GNAT family N-acetyltransferase [Peribacillus alkalitolerans]|uniref:GNAT family N-acetyltransferase n=1 Tax=Peribacillus alkalitolerans TaxID=1550385 RepID=UPI001F07A7DA|nr:GNAT family N-acetyltransferase [Peribacillus alkalitolerans]